MHLFKLQGFRKTDPDRWEFSNDSFVKGHKDQLKDITRRKATSGAHSELTVSQNQPAIEVGLQASIDWRDLGSMFAALRLSGMAVPHLLSYQNSVCRLVGMEAWRNKSSI